MLDKETIKEKYHNYREDWDKSKKVAKKQNY